MARIQGTAGTAPKSKHGLPAAVTPAQAKKLKAAAADPKLQRRVAVQTALKPIVKGKQTLDPLSGGYVKTGHVKQPAAPKKGGGIGGLLSGAVHAVENTVGYHPAPHDHADDPYFKVRPSKLTGDQVNAQYRKYLKAHPAEAKAMAAHDKQDQAIRDRQASLKGGKFTGGTIMVGTPRTAQNMATAFEHKPGATTVATLRGARNTIYALPAGLVAAAEHPKATVKAAVKDYKTRYGQSDAAQIKRFETQGVAPELLDATSVIGGGGAAAGRLATKLAEKGALGERAAEFVNTARPALRVTGGAAKAQEKSDNLFRALAQAKRDQMRATHQAKQVAKLDRTHPKPVEATRAAAHAANEEAGKVVEVTPRFSSKARSAQRRGVAVIKTRAVQGLRSEQGLRINQFAGKLVNQLSSPERRAFYYAAAGRVPTDPAKFASPAEFEHAVRTSLQDIRDRIVSHRTENAIPEPKGLAKTTDELRHIDKLLENPTAAFTPKLAETIRALHPQDIHVGRSDPRLSAAQRLHRRYAQQAEDLGHMPGPSESTATYIRRVQRAADAKGLERPLYFPSEKYALEHQPDYAAHAVGGARAAKLPFKYTGKLYRAGLQDTHPRVYLNGLARSIKAKHNWNLVADQFDAHTFKGLRNMPVSQLRSELHRRGVDMSTVAFWHPGVFRKARTASDEGRFGNITAEDARFDHVTDPEESAIEGLHGAMRTATANSEQELVAKTKADPELTKGWSVVPKAAYDEIMAATRPSGAVGRGYDIFKAKQARVLLGAGNLPWLQFQVASNAALGAVATKGNILAPLAKQALWYRGLSAEEKQFVDTLTASGAHADAHMPRMGAAADNWFINGYRALKSNPIWDTRLAGHGPTPRQLNPIEAMFSIDRFQNTQFRRAMLYDVMKKDAFRSMGEHMTKAEQLQARITGIFKLAPEERLKAILDNRELMEQHAEHVNNWMGDWVTYTDRERKVFARVPMFYGFLRFSTKLLFYTLPVHHPLVALAWAKLGQLQADELQKLGVEGLPWARGKLFIANNGQLKSVDLARANPFLNSLTGSSAPQQVLGLLPPVASAALDQIMSRNDFKNRDWRVNGAHPQGGTTWHDFGLRDRAQIFGASMLNLAYPYRAAMQYENPGPQGDDSLLFAPAPTKYKRADIVRSIGKDIKRTKDEPNRLLKQVVPFVPRYDYDPETAAQQGTTKRKKPKRTSKSFGSGSGGGGGFGSGNAGGGGFGAG